MPTFVHRALVALFLAALTLVPLASNRDTSGEPTLAPAALPAAAQGEPQGQPPSGFWMSRQGSTGHRPTASALDQDRVKKGQIIGPDERRRVDPTTSFPWRAVVSLEVDFDFGATGGYCSGTVVGPTVVLTAGHCVFDPTTVQGWATGIRVIPGRNGSSEPFSSQIASDLLAPSGYINNGTPSLDVGLVILPNSNMTSQTGRFRFMGGNGANLVGLTANIAGYPGETPTQQWWEAGPITDRTYNSTTDTGILSYPIDTTGGQSGSPIWLFNGNDRVLVGVHTRGEASTSCSNVAGANNCGTLLTSFIATQLESVGADPRVTATGPFTAEVPPSSTGPTPSATVPGATQTPTGAIGGRGLTLQPGIGNVLLTWQGGTVQTGYVVLRLASNGVNVPLGGSLPGTATSYTDPAPLPGLNCYLVAPIGGITGGSLGVSDMLCTIPGVRSPANAPQSFAIKLNQSNVAALSWSAPPPGGANGFLLVPLGGVGIPLAATTGSTTVGLSGATCYALFTTSVGAPVGNSDIVCGVPGRSTLS